MPYSSVDKPSSYFNTVLYTGNGSNNYSVTGNDFSADFIWFKCRSAGSTEHHLTDIIRGFGTGSSNTPTIQSNSTSAEFQRNIFSSTGVTSTGFSLNNYSDTNTNGATFVAWCWDANGTGVSNNSGTITSTVSANTTSGFSIVSYTGTGSNATVGHGLGVAPAMIIIKARSTTGSWVVNHKGLANQTVAHLTLETTNASADNSTLFNSTAPTSSVFSIGANTATNTSSATYIAYCFAEIKGFSKFGKYTGNGNADGTFVYTGFKPAYILVKRSDSTGSWYLQDNVRNQNFNGDPKTLQPNTTSTESTIGTWSIDNLSNGFKIRESNAAVNASGGTYIYMCFAENPFTSSKGIPCTAR